MLLSLFLKDFAIASEVEFDLGVGMTAISGETGAGKSLLVDALMLLTGSRADAASVRHGAERAELSAHFGLADAPGARDWLREQDYLGDPPSECQLRRVIRADGGSRAWINGRPATLSQLNELGQRLVEIHGQHEHQALLSRSEQLQLLDGFGCHAAALRKVSECHANWNTTRRRLAALPGGDDAGPRIAENERLLSQLSGEALDADSIAGLLSAHRRQANVANLLQGCSAALARLNGDDAPSLSRGLGQTAGDLQRLAEHEPRLSTLGETLESLQIQLDEVASELERIRDDFDLDPARLDELEAALSRLHELGRRHRVPIEGLAAIRERLQQELEDLRNADQLRDQLSADLERERLAWQQAAAALGEQRRASAERLGQAVSALMAGLGMAGGVLKIELEPNRDGAPDPLGAERVEFLVSANPGQPPRALRKVASGGELSRISLAIEVAALGADAVPTMVFDEVDSGIGGAVAEVVGRTLRGLAGLRQVLCVTHLPQVAACAGAHYRVSKSMRGGVTTSGIEALGREQRVEEIARMLGGVEITAATRSLAKQMLATGRSDGG
jgi:DNA repair protein RecN (Recombination protein N)